ncbi:MAG TPA: 2-C-methyl-D-erythritol 4-phosphate cytidylyltransferase [Actinomycetales bacterium]|nr:2-C-methyl-D-erythritol 4-phosphate cytidylyltransferase [Actinomycetales bacterium]
MNSSPSGGGPAATTACIIVAAGSGTRLGADVPKAFVQIAGRSLVEHAIDRALASGVIDEIVVVVPPAPEFASDLATHLRVTMAGGGPIRTVPGGVTRQASVQRGLDTVSSNAHVVLVHDAARCFAPPELFARVTAAVNENVRAVVPAVPVTDTIRAVDGSNVERGRLRAVQTPQGFARDVLVRAHENAAAHADDESLAATDDAGLAERIGETVHLVDGDPLAFKVTSPLDLLLAEALVDAGAVT